MEKIPLKLYSEIHCESAQCFVDYLRLSSANWTYSEKIISRQNEWIFRGHGNSNYPLTPSAWRNKKLINNVLKLAQYNTFYEFESPQTLPFRSICKENRINIKNINSLFGNIYAEIYLLELFAIISNRNGLDIPNIGLEKLPLIIQNFSLKDKKDFWSSTFGSFVNAIKNKALFSQDDYWGYGQFKDYFCLEYPSNLVAHAQHFKVPTRYLDWTYSGWKAAFFSAKQYIDLTEKEKNSVQKVCVWALNKNLFCGYPNSIERFIGGIIEFVEKFELSKFDYLRAQEGLFLKFPQANLFFYKYGRWPDLFENLQFLAEKESVDLNNIFQEKNNFFRKITLNVEHIKELLNLLNIEKINEVSMMPAYSTIYTYISNQIKT